MLQENRFLKIINYLKQNQTATLNSLAQETESSIGTVRRDLKLLEEDGMLQIVRGGAVLKNNDLTKQRFDLRGMEHQNEKQSLSKALKQVITDGQAVALNGGTTNVEVARYLAENYQRLTVITNNLHILKVMELAKSFTLLVPGGVLDYDEYTVYGKQCERDMRSYNIDVALLAVNAVSLEKGVTDFRLREIGIIRALLQSSKKRVIVAEHSKFDRISCINVCGLDQIDLIVSDNFVTEETVKKYEREAHVQVITPSDDEVTI